MVDVYYYCRFPLECMHVRMVEGLVHVFNYDQNSKAKVWKHFGPQLGKNGKTDDLELICPLYTIPDIISTSQKI